MPLTSHTRQSLQLLATYATMILSEPKQLLLGDAEVTPSLPASSDDKYLRYTEDSGTFWLVVEEAGS